MTSTDTTPTSTETSRWREFDDRDTHQDAIATALAAALDEPGF